MGIKVVKIALVLFVSIAFVYGLDRFSGKYFSRNASGCVLELETGDVLFRANSYLLAAGQLYGLSGLPGHVALVLEDGNFHSTDLLMGNCRVVEARYLDRTRRKVLRSVGTNYAFENFGAFRGRRFLLRSHLTAEQKEELLNYVQEQMDKPYRLFPDPLKGDAFNCATFARQAILYATGKDIDSNAGKIVLPNDILKNPLFDAPGDRVRF